MISTFYAYLAAFSFPVKSYAKGSGIINPEMAISDQYLTANNHSQKIYLDALGNHNLELTALLILIIILLGVLTLLLWKKNRALCYEASQIRFKLNQQEATIITDTELKLIPEEHKQQSLALNERQQKIVDLMAFGLSNKQIADKLFISENTVKYHIKNIYHVLNVKDRKMLWLSQS